VLFFIFKGGSGHPAILIGKLSYLRARKNWGYVIVEGRKKARMANNGW
jgi:hypothetical protein